MSFSVKPASGMSSAEKVVARGINKEPRMQRRRKPGR
jgi:hypothetical protein